MSTRSSTATFAALLPALRPQWRTMIESYLTATASALCLASLGVLTAWAIGLAIVMHAAPPTWWWYVSIGLVFVRTVLTWREMDLSHALAYRVLAQLRLSIFDAFARSVPSLHRDHSGRISTVATRDIEKLEFFYAHTSAQVGAGFTVYLAAIVGSWCLLPSVGVVTLVGGALVAGTAQWRAAHSRHLGDAENQVRALISARIVDSLGALREVLSFGLQAKVAGEIDALTDQGTRINRQKIGLSQLIAGLRDLLLICVLVAVIACCAFATSWSRGDSSAGISLALVPALITLALAGVSAVAAATETMTQLHPLVASATRVVDALERPAVVSASPMTVPLPRGPLGLRFNRVDFTYNGKTSVLNNWSAEIAPGEHVGLTGPSGSGKSTLITLAARLWDPTSGSIHITDATDTAFALSQLDDVELRRAIAIVDQETTLFYGSVRDNLLRGMPGLSDVNVDSATGQPSGATLPTDLELMNVLAAVNALGWVTLESHLGEGGTRLSGGQRARLCLARALVRKPRILLLDEATASLDSESAEAMSRVIASYPGTVLCASHREETLAHFDRILRID